MHNENSAKFIKSGEICRVTHFPYQLQGKEIKEFIVQKAKLAIDSLIVDAMKNSGEAIAKAQEVMDNLADKAEEWSKNTKENLHQKLMNISKKVSAILSCTLLFTL